MTYTQFIINRIEGQCPGAPIFTCDLAKDVSDAFHLDSNKANAAVSVAIKRILERKQVRNLRFYQKGIYYLAEKTPFGETGIDKEALIRRKYLTPDIGYETGLKVLYQLGLTTQIPNERTIATNQAKVCQRTDKELEVNVRPPKVPVTKENKRYLQILDAVELIEKAPIDAEHPYEILAQYVTNHNLRYHQLLALADRYYNQKTIINLAHIAAAGGAKL